MENSSAPAEVPAGWERDAATGKLRPVKGEVREQRRRNFLRRKCRHARARALACVLSQIMGDPVEVITSLIIVQLCPPDA